MRGGAMHCTALRCTALRCGLPGCRSRLALVFYKASGGTTNSTSSELLLLRQDSQCDSIAVPVPVPFSSTSTPPHRLSTQPNTRKSKSWVR